MLLVTGDSGSWTIRLRLRSADGLLVPTRLPPDAGTVFATSVLWSILRTTSSIYEQHEDAHPEYGNLAADASYRRISDSKRALATGAATYHGNICHYATPVPHAMKLFIDRLIVTTYSCPRGYRETRSVIYLLQHMYFSFR